nr:hypothetical protein [Tanacetum cinerariifolium]
MYMVERFTVDYMKGLSEFMKFAEDHRERMRETKISCPCKKCRNIVSLVDPNMIRSHLIEHGFDKNYTCWDLYGNTREPRVDSQTFVSDTNHEENDSNEDNHRDNLDEMLHDMESNVDEKNVKNYSNLVKLLDLKAKDNWSDKSFTTLLELLHEVFPKDNELYILTYQAKKLTCSTGLEVQRIHACLNDCILYRKDYKDLHECPVCMESRYKHKNLMELNSNVTNNGPPAKLLWYLPIIPRLKKLYANPKDAKLLRWHAKERKNNGKMRHVADSPQWKNINRYSKKFGSEVRNIQFGLCSDGINPFKSLSSRHSTWPILLCIYNLPPWLCMKQKYIMMSLLIQDVDIYDAYKKERFKLFAMIYCTIKDFPAYKNLSGKTKDGVNARKDMVEMGIRNELAPRVPSGYSANIKILVSMKDLKLLGMKSHDCHVLLTQMIPIVIREVMPPPVRQIVTKLCLFFNMIHSKVIDHEKLDELQRDIILILCQLEMYFPPSFFDVMVHLMSHIVEEIKLAGLVFLWYMYPFKRYMGFLKGYVRNRYRPKGGIVQGYVAKEVVQFCTNYMDDVAHIGLPQPRHQGRLDGVGTIGRKDVTLTNDNFEQAHFTILQNMTYKVIRISPTNVDADVIQLGYHPRHSSRMTIAKNSYYGVVEDIWKLDYTSFVIPLLKCKWVNNTRGVKVDSDGFTCVNLSTNCYLSDPFIRAKQATQVFYVEDPKDKRWHIVLQSKRSIVSVDDVVNEDEYNKFDELPPFSIDVQSTNDVLSDTLDLRSGHQKGHED